MALEATGVEAVERGMSAGFALPMRDGERTVTVVISHEALRAFGPGTPDAKDSLRAHRGRIEDIARRKFENGEIAANGRILILPRDFAP